jgi:hypothetical protein
LILLLEVLVLEIDAADARGFVPVSPGTLSIHPLDGRVYRG